MYSNTNHHANKGIAEEIKSLKKSVDNDDIHGTMVFLWDSIMVMHQTVNLQDISSTLIPAVVLPYKRINR